MVTLGGRMVRGKVEQTGRGDMLVCDLTDWDGLGLVVGEHVLLLSPDASGGRVVRHIIRCPGGEPVAWVWLGRG